MKVGNSRDSADVRIVIAVTDPQTLHLLRGFPRFLSDNGYSVTLACSPATSLEATGRIERVATASLPMHRKPAPISDLITLLRCCRVLRRERPHIVHASTPKAGLIFTLAGWLLHVRRRIYLVRGLPLETSHGFSRLVLWTAERIACAAATDVVCVSASLRERLVELGIADPAKLTLIGAGSSNGVDLTVFAPSVESDRAAGKLRSRLGVPLTAAVVGFAGRLAIDKGIDVIADAWATLAKLCPDAHLVIAGAADSRQPVPDSVLARLKQHPRVHFLGHFEELPQFYRLIDVLMLPSRREGFSNVLLEAAASGRPVVASNVTGCRDVVVNGVTGALVPVEDAAGFASAVSEYLRDRSRAAAAGHAGREWAAAHFGRERVWNAWKEFLAK